MTRQALISGRSRWETTRSGMLARASFQPFNTGDPVEVSMCLNVVLETAYTNPLVVALPQVGGAEG